MQFRGSFFTAVSFIIYSSNFCRQISEQLPTSYHTKSVMLASQSGFLVRAHNGKDFKTWKIKDSFAVLQLINNKLVMHGKPIAHDSFDIVPIAGSLVVNGYPMQGPVGITKHQKTMQVKGIVDVPRNLHAYQLLKPVIDASAHLTKQVISPTSLKDMHKHMHMNVRVLLGEHVHDKKESWTLFCPSGFEVFDHDQKYFVEQNTLICTTHKGQVQINGYAMEGKTITIVPRGSERVAYNNKEYKGTFGLIVRSSSTLLINMLDLEEYTYAVVRSETWPSWPLEVNKAVAIACRSYAMAMMARARASKLAYDVKDSNIHQQYNLYGSHDNLHIKKAVQETAGMCVVYKGKPILAMYDICCGQVIPAHIDDFDFEKAPYLKRTYACTFCSKSSSSKWKINYDRATFERMLGDHAVGLGVLREIKVKARDKAGRVKTVLIKGRKSERTLPGKKFYSLSKEIKSFAYSISFGKNGIVTVDGNGHGHHMGACLWALPEMLKRGYTYKSMLSFFYPGTHLKRLQG